MDEEKKAEELEEKPEQLGPYQLLEQMPQSARSEGVLYRATHETSGATALVLKLPAAQGEAPLKEWRVSLVCSSASSGYVAMQVEQTPWSRAPDRQSMESLVFTFEGVREAVRRMARAVPEPYEHRLPWRPGLGVASVAAACALLLGLVRLAPVFRPPSGPEPVASTPPASMSHEAPTAGGNPDLPHHGGLVDTADAGASVLTRPLPKEPFKGQKRPPCTRYTEVELIGACWAPHELKAPCPDSLYEYQGKCYLPTFSAKPPPQSLEQ